MGVCALPKFPYGFICYAINISKVITRFIDCDIWICEPILQSLKLTNLDWISVSIKDVAKPDKWLTATI